MSDDQPGSAHEAHVARSHSVARPKGGPVTGCPACGLARCGHIAATAAAEAPPCPARHPSTRRACDLAAGHPRLHIAYHPWPSLAADTWETP